MSRGDLRPKLVIDQRYQVQAIPQFPDDLRQQCMQMGLMPGHQFRLVQVAPLGDPLILEINGVRWAMRKKDLDVLVYQRV